MPSRIFIVDDYVRLREMLEALVEAAEGFESCGSAEEALEQVPEAGANLVLIDVSLPGKSGLDLLVELRALHPEILCVMLSGHHSKEYAERSRAAGAKAYIAKSSAHDLVPVLRDVLAGASRFAGFP
jgi:DNA-binding NarL/FixJ family response regulator